MAKGFAAMTPEQRKAISSLGGKAAHKKGSAHVFSSDQARDAGRKGGLTVSKDREHMVAIGREGCKANSTKRVVAEGASAATDALVDGQG